jgi:hypothetical protein
MSGKHNKQRSPNVHLIKLLPAVLLAALAGCSLQASDGGGNSPPPFGPVSFQLPADGAVVEAPFDLAVTGEGITRVYVEIDLAVVGDLKAKPYQMQVVPAALSKGRHVVSVRALSQSGAFQDKSIEFFVKRPRPPLADLAAQIADLGPGEWTFIPETQLADVGYDDPLDPRGSIGGLFSSSGGCYDTKRDRLVVWGGGGDTFHNEVYAFDIATLNWLRLNDPSPWPLGGENNAFFLATHPDGAPVSRHSYDSVEYDSIRDRMYLGGGQAAAGSSPVFDDTVYEFDFDTQTWTHNGQIAAAGFGTVCGIAPDGRIYQQGGGFGSNARFAVHDPAGPTTTLGAQWPSSFGLGASGEVDALRNRFLSVGNGATFAWTLDDVDAAAVEVATTGDTQVENAQGPGLVYHPTRDPNFTTST